MSNKLQLMKTFLTTIFFILLAFSSFSQDAILKRDGTKIDAKVVEITESTIKYRNFDQPDGPIRNIAKNDVKEIIYENGTWEKFELTETAPSPKPSETIPKNVSRMEKDYFFMNGFFIEGMIGMNNIRQGIQEYDYYYDSNGQYIEEFKTSTINDIYINIGLRLGNKWYFGSGEKWRPGIQVTYLKLGLFVNPNAGFGYSSFLRSAASIGNVGFANVFKFNEKIGMEANANVGLSLLNFTPPFQFDPTAGINYGIAAKFRYNGFAVGLDYSRIDANFNRFDRVSMDILTVTIGRKF